MTVVGGNAALFDDNNTTSGADPNTLTTATAISYDFGASTYDIQKITFQYVLAYSG